MEPSQRRRAGCTECKRKKAKCDEKRPSCSRCYKYPHLCSYELSVKSFRVAKRKPANNAQILTQPSSTDETADEQQVSLAPSSVATSNQLISYTDMSDTFESNFISSSMIDDPSNWLSHFPAESPPRHSLSISFPSSPPLRSDPRRIYFQHFVVHTATVYWPLQPDMALSLILPAADLSPCIMGAMIAASSSQLFRMVRNPESRSAAITATVECLGNLREAITTPRFGDVGVTILPTTLMLATTCVCAGDTATFRKHLNGALHVVQRDKSKYSLDPLWWMSLKWLVHLLLMNRLSGLPLPSRQTKGFIDWDYLLTCMPDLGRIDFTSGFSRELVAALNMVCELSEPSCMNVDASGQLYGNELARSVYSHELELRLIELREKSASTVTDVVLRTELENSHRLFTDATLLCLYRRVDELPKDNPKVQTTVNSIITSLQKIDKQSPVHAQLLWPLLAAGCDSTTHAERTIVVETMESMTARGLGSYENVLEFMRDYWKNGGDMRWDLFAKQTGKDLVLF
ncbi:hypothetical protein FOQG_16724 [Fusarium oxysporum f. sp. raphani 54005]|uniref:Zn(2)-C6 fungal-type domain-containing protein n=2 Tax=Fusarium oxysporum TaxID=5507 RepID=X0BJH1_FUSOX|nr:hypothetical protein FOVG_14214 [Fusarium oxysporum f. sp. pisi HDV247]EXK78609.1 hypothetical protein FOQG_16724 [Fusarium oxysporum f. sp. raphani 54005]